MDPNAAMIDLLEAIETGSRIDAENALDDLMRWIRNGGFPPNTAAAIETLRERMKDAS
jgi:hypothetical protein